MGFIFSFCKKKNNEIEDTTTLLTIQHCFVCNKVFSDNVKYNRHIPHCKINTLNDNN